MIPNAMHKLPLSLVFDESVLMQMLERRLHTVFLGFSPRSHSDFS